MTAFLLLYAVLASPAAILLPIIIAGLWCGVSPGMGSDQ